MRCFRRHYAVCLISALSVFSLVIQFMVLLQRSPCTVNRLCTTEFSDKIQHGTSNKVTYKDYLDRPSSDLTSLQNEWKVDATLFHKFPKEKRFLTLGIPTIRRVGDEYIMDTIKSLVNNTRPKELKDIYIVIFLADFNETWIDDISKRLNKSYPQLISLETLVVIRSWKSFHPSLENLNHTYNDKYEKWRSKQNVDYAFIFLYCQHLSTYYMQMEDDVYTISNYPKVIKEYISTMTFPWTCLEFSELGFTGKVQPLKDRFFDNLEKTYKGDNPPAKLYTNLVVQSSFTPESAYILEPGYFWSQSNGKRGDWFTVVFDDPQRVEKIIIDTGSREHPTDKIEHGKLQASLSLLSIEQSQPKCTNDIDLGYLSGGFLKVDNLTSILRSFRIHCLSLILTANQDWWIIIKEIAVFVAD
uniref:Alpha-1,3-mannosyl-glycoprotein 4-beta-N-acetylglucosaminyltransferase C n=1 Tax=Magallana gigas TaxID=29159 RepID=A0A8W8M620_MAGGI